MSVGLPAYDGAGIPGVDQGTRIPSLITGFHSHGGLLHPAECWNEQTVASNLGGLNPTH